MIGQVPHSKPWLTVADLGALRAVLDTKMLAQGEATAQFEHDFSTWVGATGGVATSSGTAALALSLEALDVGMEHQVIMPSYVCRSVMEAVVSAGAQPVLVDVGVDWLMTPANCAPYVSSSTKAIIVPHMYGMFAELAAFRDFGVPLIEDCAQAIGGKSERAITGDIAVFSFHPTKCLTTGEGGMAVSEQPDLVARLRELRDGSARSEGMRLFAPMSDLAAALGLSQLRRYGRGLTRRREIARRYRSALDTLIPDGLHREALARSMFFRFPVTIAGGISRFEQAFASHGITVRRGVDQLLHRLLGLDDADFPNTVKLYETTVSLPIYPAMTERQVQACLNAIVAVFSVHD